MEGLARIRASHLAIETIDCCSAAGYMLERDGPCRSGLITDYDVGRISVSASVAALCGVVSYPHDRSQSGWPGCLH